MMNSKWNRNNLQINTFDITSLYPLRVGVTRHACPLHPFFSKG